MWKRENCGINFSKVHLYLPSQKVSNLRKLLTEDRIGQGALLEVTRRTERLTLQIVPEEVPDKKK
jgi:hypothetical protein